MQREILTYLTDGVTSRVFNNCTPYLLKCWTLFPLFVNTHCLTVAISDFCITFCKHFFSNIAYCRDSQTH